MRKGRDLRTKEETICRSGKFKRKKWVRRVDFNGQKQATKCRIISALLVKNTQTVDYIQTKIKIFRETKRDRFGETLN